MKRKRNSYSQTDTVSRQEEKKSVQAVPPVNEGASASSDDDICRAGICSLVWKPAVNK